MTGCCQGTSSPTGRLCGDCPHKKPAVSRDLLDPKDIAARMKAAGTFDKDEPWPGWNGGKKLIEKETAPPPVDDDLPDEVKYIDPMASWLAMDFSKIEERVLAFFGLKLPENWDSMSNVERGTWMHESFEKSGFKIHEGKFHTGGVVASPTGRSLFGMGASHESLFPPGLVVNGSLRGYSEYNKGPKNWDRGQVVVHVHGMQAGKTADLDATILDTIAKKMTPKERLKQMLVPSRVFEDKEFLLTQYDESTQLKKRYLTRAEVADVKCGSVTFQDERGNVWREDRRGWSDRDEERLRDLRRYVAEFNRPEQRPEDWTPGEARIYSMYRAADAQKKRGYMVRSKQRVR